MDTRYLSLALGLVITASIFVAGIIAASKSSRLPFTAKPTTSHRKQVIVNLALILGGCVLLTGALGVWAILSE